jgi:hypothetical protein
MLIYSERKVLLTSMFWKKSTVGWWPIRTLFVSPFYGGKFDPTITKTTTSAFSIENSGEFNTLAACRISIHSTPHFWLSCPTKNRRENDGEELNMMIRTNKLNATTRRRKIIPITRGVCAHTAIFPLRMPTVGGTRKIRNTTLTQVTLLNTFNSTVRAQRDW